MSGAERIDVLEVIDYAAEMFGQHGWNASANSLDEARAAVAALVEEARILLHGVDSVQGLTVVQPHDVANLRAALARVQGAAP